MFGYIFVMYYIYGISGPSLFIESTDSMIIAIFVIVQCHAFMTCHNKYNIIIIAINEFNRSDRIN